MSGEVLEELNLLPLTRKMRSQSLMYSYGPQRLPRRLLNPRPHEFQSVQSPELAIVLESGRLVRYSYSTEHLHLSFVDNICMTCGVIFYLLGLLYERKLQVLNTVNLSAHWPL
jgi:hypothetical protein